MKQSSRVTRSYPRLSVHWDLVFAEKPRSGVVSVGFLLEDIQETIALYRDRIVVIGAAILLLGIMGTLWIARKVKESIFGLEPAQIGRMYQENQAVLESIREGIVAVNTDGAVTLANQTAMNLIGPSERQELLEEDQKEWLRSLRLVEVMQTGVAEFDQETFVGGKAVVVNRVPILDNERKVTGAVASFRDRSELFRVTQELSRVKEYAEALRSQTHEYSNKLHLISALIQLESYQEAVDFISAEVDVHVSNTQMIMRLIPDPLIGGLLLGKVNQANERKIALTIDPDSHIREIPAAIDRSLLIVILGNLIDNAMEAVCANGAYAKEISVYLGQMDELLLVEIEDRGPGIPEAYASKVFERGFSTKQLQDHGYGLHLAKEAVEQLDGIWSIWLPRERQARICPMASSEDRNEYTGGEPRKKDNDTKKERKSSVYGRTSFLSWLGKAAMRLYPINSLTARREALLVFGHDIVLGELGLMQIERDVAHLEALEGKLIERKLEKLFIVSLHMNLAIGLQYLTIGLQEARVRETAFGVASFRPRVAEIQVQAGKLLIGKQICQHGSVELDECQIGNFTVLRALYSPQDHFCFQLNRNEIHVRVAFCQCINEASLSTADFDMDRIVVSEAFVPAPFEGYRVVHERRIFTQGRFGTWYVAQSHMCLLKKELLSTLR